MPIPVSSSGREPLRTALPFHIEDIVRALAARALTLSTVVCDKISVTGNATCGQLVETRNVPWTRPTLLNGWADYLPGVWWVATFRKVRFYVEIQGLIGLGTIGQPAFNLPKDYRPHRNLIFAQIDGVDSGQRLTVQSNGDVIPAFGNNAFFSLNCRFDLGGDGT